MKKATILKNSMVLETPHKEGKVLINVDKGAYVEYTRERNKNGIIWLEITLEGNMKGYIVSKNTFKWKTGKVRDSASFYPDILKSEEKKYEVLLSDDIVHVILPSQKDAQKKSIATVIDSKERIGTLNEKQIRIKDANNIITILAAIVALAFTVIAVIRIFSFMLEGGQILIGGIVIFGCLFLWAILFKIINAGFNRVYQHIYEFFIRF